MCNNGAIRTPPEDGNWGFNLSEIELKLPTGTVDPDYEPVYHEVETSPFPFPLILQCFVILTNGRCLFADVGTQLPNWGETEEDARARFERVVRALADKYPFENLLLITHGN